MAFDTSVKFNAGAPIDVNKLINYKIILVAYTKLIVVY